MWCEGQRRAEHVDVVTVSTRAEAGVQNVVRSGHALDDITGEICVNAVGGDVDAVTSLELEVVHGDEGNKSSVVRLVVLLSQTWNHVGDIAVFAELLLGNLHQRVVGLAYGILRGQEHFPDNLL